MKGSNLILPIEKNRKSVEHSSISGTKTKIVKQTREVSSLTKGT